MAKESVVQLDKDTVTQLEQVKQGKPRKFVMIVKSAAVTNLIVYKKGSFEALKNQAKKEAGGGQVYFGVVDGRGQNINFKLAAADDFDKAPVKTPVLREFLASAGFDSKAMFELVQSQAPVLDETDPRVQRFMQLQEKALAFCDANPDKAGEVNELCLAIGKDFDQEQGDAAEGKLAKLEALLGASGTTATPTTPSSKTPTTATPKSEVPPKAPPPPPVTAPDRKLAAALKYLAPSIAQSQRAFPESKDEIAKLKTAVEAHLAAGKIDEGNQALKELEQKLASLSAVDPLKAEEFHEQWDAARETWDDAVAKVREQLSNLQVDLLASDDEELQAIGEFGLNAITKSHLTPLAAALMELDSAAAGELKRAAKRVQNLVGAFREHIKSSAPVKACDENPFGIEVTIAATLTPAFDVMDKTLATVTG